MNLFYFIPQIESISKPNSYSSTQYPSDDLERRPSIEVGEDPLTSEMGVDPLMRGTTSSSPSDTSVFAPPSTRLSKSRGKDDSVFLTDDSWLELRGK